MLRGKLGNKRTWIVAGVAALAICAVVGWLEREPLQAWLYLRGLARADEADRSVWVERVAGLDGAAVPGLVALLGQDDARACGNARAALTVLCARWSVDDPRRLDLTRRLVEGFSRFSALGQQNVLQLAAAWFDAGPPSAEIARIVARLLEEAARASGSEMHAAALELADRFLGQAHDPEQLGSCRALIQSCFQDADTANRVRAVELALRPGLDLQNALVALLNDPAAEVRRLALPAVASSKDTIETEDLLRWLHDSDAEVRRQCERVLRRSRRLSEEEIRLGRLITDPSALVRLQVLNYLQDGADAGLYPAVWLRHLSHDAAPEVRFAAIRAIREQGVAELSDRIDQMAHNDPSPTVCDFAQRCLSSQQKPTRPR